MANSSIKLRILRGSSLYVPCLNAQALLDQDRSKASIRLKEAERLVVIFRKQHQEFSDQAKALSDYIEGLVDVENLTTADRKEFYRESEMRRFFSRRQIGDSGPPSPSVSSLMELHMLDAGVDKKYWKTLEALKTLGDFQDGPVLRERRHSSPDCLRE